MLGRTNGRKWFIRGGAQGGAAVLARGLRPRSTGREAF
jgi:hypothetical protein